ncbi:MAG: hypothetical protein HUJ70_05190, partial [Pseudobutyrivibrio sp.]|nr:hypothetical protein [Pseudobutyrivibrio sp.]
MAAGVLSLGKIKIAHVLVILMVGFVMLMPLILSAFSRFVKVDDFAKIQKPSAKRFLIAMAFMAVVVGGFIPSTVIMTSPQEFISSMSSFNPVIYVLSALCYSAGFFVIWMGVFYWIAGKSNRIYFEAGAIALCGVAAFDYFGFNSYGGMMSNTLKYDYGLMVRTSMLAINLALALVVAGLLILLYKRFSGYFVKIAGIATAAFSVLTVVNVVNINNEVKPVLEKTERYRVAPQFELSATGKNVVVIMLDRAINQYLPLIIEEDPTVKETFSGFTYYPNTLSFGYTTNIASSALFGGYEYTPEAMNLRDDKRLEDKHNEALKLMPVLFSENDFKTTVCDPPYANYQWTTDLSVYDDYPEIEAYQMMGNF